MSNMNTNLVQMMNLMGSNNRAPILMPEEYHQWANRMEDYLYGLDPDVWRSIEIGPCVPTTDSNSSLQSRLIASENVPGALTSDEKKMISNDMRCKRELKLAIPTNIFALIQNCKTAQDIWLRLKYLYEGNKTQLMNKKTNLLSEFKDFKQKENETLDDVFRRYTVLLDGLERAGIVKDSHEVNVTFMHSLAKEWKFISTLIKGHEQFNLYSIYDIHGMMKTH